MSGSRPNPNPMDSSERYTVSQSSRLKLGIQDGRMGPPISDIITNEKFENSLEPRSNKGSKFRMNLQAARDDHFFVDE